MVSLADVREAAKRIAGAVERTPCLHSHTLSRLTGAEVFLKFENLQFTASFKERGALNRLLLLPAAERQRGVIAMSAGNHAQGVAYHAARLGIRSVIVMPKGTPNTKLKNTQVHGAEVVLEGDSLTEAATHAHARAAREGLTFIHPYDDPAIIAGQGTVAMEMLADRDDLDVIVTPVGGGGLLSGTALAAAYFSPATQVVGAEPAGADDAARSLAAGEIVPSVAPRTIADGLLSSLGELTFAVIRRLVERIVTVGDDAVVSAMRLVWERMKIVVEPSAAVPLAALLEGELDVARRRVGIIFSGGNVDLTRLPWIPEAGLR